MNQTTIDQPEAKEAEPFVMPYVEVGMTVWWYLDGDRMLKPHAATVTAVGPQHISVGVLSDGHANYMVHDGVRHIDDPHRVDADNEEGAWEHTRHTKLVMELTDIQKMVDKERAEEAKRLAAKAKAR